MSFLQTAWSFLKLHKKAVGISLGAGAVVGGTAALISRSRAAAVGEKVVAKIMTILGTNYRWGSRDPSSGGVDCSGTIVWALRELGLEPKKFNATAADLWKQCSRVVFPVAGDLVFYGSLFGGITHVMTAMGDGRVIGASGGGPSTTTAAAAKAANACVKILPLDYRKDVYAFGRLPLQEVKDEAIGGGLNMLGSV